MIVIMTVGVLFRIVILTVGVLFRIVILTVGVLNKKINGFAKQIELTL